MPKHVRLRWAVCCPQIQKSNRRSILRCGASAVRGGLATHFAIRTLFIHNITDSGFCSGNVIANVRGVDLALDHHRYAPHESLFTDLDAGAGRRFWKCGGGADLGKHCGARGTFWNIRSSKPLSYPPPGFAPTPLNLIVLETTEPSQTTPEGKWFEAIKPVELEPQDLREAQLRR